MTEAEWLACDDPTPMLEFIRGKASDRKLRLFACACCRRIWRQLTERRSRRLVEASESYADGESTGELLGRAWERADEAFQAVHLSGGGDVDQNPAQAVLGLGTELDVGEVAEMAAATFGAVARGKAYERIWQAPGKENKDRWAEDDAVRTAAAEGEGRVQSNLLRCVFGNPFRPVAFDPSWHTSTVVALASQMYESRDFSTMPILADALMDAGCDHDDVLNHCRDGKQTHVRGCWVVDVILGKE